MIERLSRNPRNFIVLALILALIAAGLVYLLLNNATKSATTTPGTGGTGITTTINTAPQYKAVVAVVDIPTTTVLNNSAVIQKFFAEVPYSQKAPADAFPSLQDFLAYISTGRGGRYTGFPIIMNELIRKPMLLDMQGRAAFSLSLAMPAGVVAESVAVGALPSANAGIQAGDQVDVLLTARFYRLMRSRHVVDTTVVIPAQSQTLLQNVPVLAAAPGVYTLLLNHQDAVLLKFVKDADVTGNGQPGSGIELVLRSSQDVAAKDFKTIPVITEYLTRGLKNNFTLPTLPADAFPTAIPAKQ